MDSMILGVLLPMIIMAVLGVLVLPLMMLYRKKMLRDREEEKIKKEQLKTTLEKEKLERELMKQQLQRDADLELQNKQPKFCQYCGSKIPAGSHECSSCGAKLQQ